VNGGVLITGGAGFIGTNLAARMAGEGRRVRVLDNLSRAGVEENLDWLRRTHGARIEVEIGDVRDADLLRRAVRGAATVYHLAAQVAVTSSLDDPAADASVNVGGTLALLEAVRLGASGAMVVFASTNKVYGSLDSVPTGLDRGRHLPLDPRLRGGLDESTPLCFCTPYGCSKGAADQYVADYHRSFGLDTLVFRLSCIYGPHQHGTEDQGWVAHFLRAGLGGRSITIYGDGRQVRDVLYVDDLVDALALADSRRRRLAGGVFNLGGGPANAISVREAVDLASRLLERPLAVRAECWRTGDQRYYVSDTSAFTTATGWRPRVHPEEGFRRLAGWLRPELAAERAGTVTL
jgi:CDP-paratose 2-epimerase